LDAVAHFERGVDGFGVVVHGVAASLEFARDGRLGHALEQEFEDSVLGRADLLCEVGPRGHHAGTELGVERRRSRVRLRGEWTLVGCPLWAVGFHVYTTIGPPVPCG